LDTRWKRTITWRCFARGNPPNNPRVRSN